MHRGTPASDSMKSIAVTVSLMSVFLSVQGLITDSEVFFVLLFGFNLFVIFYFIGIMISLVILFGITRESPKIEYAGMIMATWFYTMLCLFLAVVTYLHSTIIVICFGIAMINAILAAYIKRGKIDGEENISSGSPLKDKLRPGLSGSDSSP